VGVESTAAALTAREVYFDPVSSENTHCGFE
jgi:hypothetical protein